MRKELKLLLAFLGGIIFASCQRDELSIQSSIAATALEFKTIPLTRFADQSFFDAGDSVGIYSVMWVDNDNPRELASNGNHRDNVPYILLDENDSWESPDPIYYPVSGRYLDLYAYYPFSQNPMNENAQLKVSVIPDQRNLKHYKKSDFKAAISRKLRVEDGPIHFDFYHRLSQIKFELIPGTGVQAEDLLESEIKLKNVVTDGLYSYTGGEPDLVYPGTIRDDIIPCGTLMIMDGKVVGQAAIIIPQSLNEASTIEVSIYNKVYTADFSRQPAFGSGESRVISLTISSLGIEIETEIKPWDEQPPVEEKEIIGTFTVDCPVGAMLFFL